VMGLSTAEGEEDEIKEEDGKEDSKTGIGIGMKI